MKCEVQHGFLHEENHSFTKDQLLQWFRDCYPERKPTDGGIPDGLIKRPVLNVDGKLE